MGPGGAPRRVQKLDGAGGLQRVRDRPGQLCVCARSVGRVWVQGRVLVGGCCGLCGFRFSSVQFSSIQNLSPVQSSSGQVVRCAVHGRVGRGIGSGNFSQAASGSGQDSS